MTQTTVDIQMESRQVEVNIPSRIELYDDDLNSTINQHPETPPHISTADEMKDMAVPTPPPTLQCEPMLRKRAALENKAQLRPQDNPKSPPSEQQKPHKPAEADENATLRQKLVHFSSETDAHGVRRLTNPEASSLQRGLWCLFVFGCIAFLGYYLGDRITEYYKYRTQTKIDSRTVPVIKFPAVTVCNKNDVSMNILTTLEGNLQEEIIKHQIGGSAIGANDIKYVKKFSASFVKQIYNMVKDGQLGNGSIKVDYKEILAPLSYNKTTMIVSCKFHGVDCDYDQIVETIIFPYGRCYTINPSKRILSGNNDENKSRTTTTTTTPPPTTTATPTNSSKRKKTARPKAKKSIPFITSSPGVELRLDLAVDEDGFNHLKFRKLFLKFSAEELSAYFPNNRPGLLVQFHDSDDPPDFTLKGKVPVYPSNIMDVFLAQRTIVKSLETPYGDCVKTNMLKYFNHYSVFECLRECAYKAVITNPLKLYTNKNRTKCMPAYTRSNLLAEMGGMMGLFIGISVLSIIHLFEFIFLMVFSTVQHYRHKNRTKPEQPAEEKQQKEEEAKNEQKEAEENEGSTGEEGSSEESSSFDDEWGDDDNKDLAHADAKSSAEKPPPALNGDTAVS